jgi:tRNA(fMet)-specific endonuclease VapC
MKPRVVLDTNAYSALMSGDVRIAEMLSDAEEVIVPIAVLGELHDGFRGGTRRKENEKILALFLSKSNVRVPDMTASNAERYGEIKDALRKAGHPVPTNDIWIAAQAAEATATVITFDRHFEYITEVGVDVELLAI